MVGKLVLLAGIVCSLAVDCYSQGVDANRKASFKQRVIISGLNNPWEIAYGPDHQLWVTEAKGYLVSRINPATGKKTVILDLNSERSFSDDPWPQGGLMGMALHPQLLAGKPYVYLAYAYRFLGTKPNFQGTFFHTKLVRYIWKPKEQRLADPITICDTIPGSNDHNGGRLLIAAMEGREFLFYAVGDMGGGQFDNGNRPNHAQDIRYYEGKILRFNTEEDGNVKATERWIPDTNPFKNAVWSYGHRNPQGLASAVINNNVKLYSSEHGPYSDDEINLIEKGANYGHPLIIGDNDGNYNGLAASVSDRDSLPGKWNTTYPLIDTEAGNVKKIGSSYRDPIKAFYVANHSFLSKLFNSEINKTQKVEWPAIAPSSLAVYTSDAIPSWKNSLLIPSLKEGRLIRLKLDSSGTKVQKDEESYFKSDNRYRDIAISPDGKKLYLITDRASATSGPTKDDAQKTPQKGEVIEFTYEGK